MPEVKTVVLRTLNRDEAKAEIQDFMGSGKSLFYSDIAEALFLSLPMVVDLVDELAEEGTIVPVKGSTK